MAGTRWSSPVLDLAKGTVGPLLAGNHRAGSPATYLWRLLFDRDQRIRPAQSPGPAP